MQIKLHIYDFILMKIVFYNMLINNTSYNILVQPIMSMREKNRRVRY